MKKQNKAANAPNNTFLIIFLPIYTCRVQHSGVCRSFLRAKLKQLFLLTKKKKKNPFFFGGRPVRVYGKMAMQGLEM
jgi:hypothetical protein